jgi:hypothetical protein
MGEKFETEITPNLMQNFVSNIEISYNHQNGLPKLFCHEILGYRLLKVYGDQIRLEDIYDQLSS